MAIEVRQFNQLPRETEEYVNILFKKNLQIKTTKHIRKITRRKKVNNLGSEFVSGDIKKSEWFGESTSNILEF